MSYKSIKLDCGLFADIWINGNEEYLDISLFGLLEGCGEENDMLILSKLFSELNQKGYLGQGCSMKEGYYGSIDDLILRVKRSLL